jgi:hypothetical protein
MIQGARSHEIKINEIILSDEALFEVPCKVNNHNICM